MKKNLRSKILLCVLAGGVLAANTALAAKVYTETISGANDNYGTKIKTDESNGIYKYNFGENAELNVNNENFAIFINENNKNDVNEIVINTPLDIYLTNNTQIHGTYGIYIDDNTGADISGKVIDRSGGGIIKVVSDKRELNENSGTIVRGVGVLSGNNNIVKIGNATVIVDAVYDENFFADASGLYAQNTDNEIIMDGGSIEVTADVNDGTNSARATGVSALSGSKIIIIGNTDITATAFSNNEAYADGIYVYKAANIKHENGKIEAVAQGANVLMARGLTLDTDGATANLGIVDISAKTIGGSNANSFGVWTINESTANIAGGSITAKAYNSDGISENKDAYVAAILSEDTSAINVNHGTTNDVVINGDILTFDNSTVNLNLNTINSEINGAIYKGSTNGTNLTLANGAEWNVGGNYNSNITNLDMNGGIINQNTSKYIDIENYSGSGYINFTAENTDNDGVLDFANTGDVTIESAEAGSSVNLGVINNTVNTLDIEKTEESLNAIAQKLTYEGTYGNLGGKVTVKEGLITPEASADLMFDGNSQGYVTNITGGDRVTKTMDAMKNLAATAIVAWRQEESTLSQRLGELRESDGGQGIWVRMSRGEFEYDGEYKNQYNFFQMGYDWAAGSWHYCAAVSHNDGQTTYTHGDGENRSTSLSLYGTWLGDKGHYADIVLKQGRLSNDFDIYTEAGHTSGDYDAWGTSLSGEYGMKVDLDGGWYVTPQAQLTLMRIGGEDYTTNNGIKVNQDSLESAVGRVGFEVGKRISDSGSIYAKASLLHDFAGSADTYLSYKGLTNSYHQDIGDTWCEAGIGFNYKTSANSYVYADVVKTFGGDVETPWQWNAGMRWTF